MTKFTTQQINIMNQNNQVVNCPKCGEQINVNALLHHQIEAELSQSFAMQLASQKAEFELQLNTEKTQLEQTLKIRLLADSQSQIEAMQNELNEKSLQLRDFNKTKVEIERLQREKLELRETFEAESQAKIHFLLIEERKKTEQLLRANLQAESQAQIEMMQNELNAKSEQLRDFNKTKIDIERLQREKEEQREKIEAELEAKLNQQLREEKSLMELKMRDKDYALDELKKQLQEAHRKAEQGSMQSQGEVQELAIEEWLKQSFPLDHITEIKKGQHGADCIQVVNTRDKYECGMIYYESKRTKEFGRDWIEKFKTDLREKNATVGVLVTQTMPKDMDRMGLKEGIWICNFEEFKGLSAVLRDTVVRLYEVAIPQENKGEKMVMLYDFLTSSEFKSYMEAILEGFTQMKADLEKEKRAMATIWQQREKQIEKVSINTSKLYGSFKGIAGNAVLSVPQLELGAAYIN